MSIRYNSKENYHDVINGILNKMVESENMYEINIKEEKLNNIYRYVEIKIKIDEG